MLNRDNVEAVRRFPSLVVRPRPGVAVACATSRFEQAAGHTAGAGETAARSTVGKARNVLVETDSKNWVHRGRQVKG